MGKRVLMYFSSLNDHYAGIVDGYDSEKDGGCYYRVVFDDGDEEDYPWRDVQLGIFWNVTGGFVPAEHEEPLPTGSIASAGGVEWALADEKELKPRLPLLKNHYESTDGAGLFQGETNYLRPDRARRHRSLESSSPRYYRRGEPREECQRSRRRAVPGTTERVRRVKP